MYKAYTKEISASDLLDIVSPPFELIAENILGINRNDESSQQQLEEGIDTLDDGVVDLNSGGDLDNQLKQPKFYRTWYKIKRNLVKIYREAKLTSCAKGNCFCRVALPASFIKGGKPGSTYIIPSICEVRQALKLAHNDLNHPGQNYILLANDSFIIQQTIPKIYSIKRQSMIIVI